MFISFKPIIKGLIFLVLPSLPPFVTTIVINVQKPILMSPTHLGFQSQNTRMFHIPAPYTYHLKFSSANHLFKT